jgi:hypothetical protein
MYRFPGPDGSMYTFDVYYGCSGCGCGPGIMFHRYSKRAVEDELQFVLDIDEVPWSWGAPSEDYAAFMPPLIDPEALAADIVQVVGDVECTLDDETVKLSELFDSERELLYEAIGENMNRAFGEWRRKLEQHLAAKSQTPTSATSPSQSADRSPSSS